MPPHRSVGREVEQTEPGTAVRVHPGAYTVRTKVADPASTTEGPIWLGGAPVEPAPVIEGVGGAPHPSRARYVDMHDLELQDTYEDDINCGGDYEDPQATGQVVPRPADPRCGRHRLEDLCTTPGGIARTMLHWR